MKAGDHPYRVGFTVAFVGWLLSLLVPQQRNWYIAKLEEIGAALAAAWRWLFQDRHLSYGTLLGWATACVLVYLMVRLWLQAWRRGQLTQELTLSPDELRVLVAIASLDGTSAEIASLANALGMGRLEMSHVLGRLDCLEFVTPARGHVIDEIEGRQFVRLTGTGIDYCAKRGLLKRGARASLPTSPE